MKFKVILFLLAVLILLSGAGSFALAGNLDRFAGAKGTLRIAGGTAHIPVMKEAAKRIMNINPNIRINIAGGGSGVGIKQVGEGLVNIGNSGRKATKDEIARGLYMNTRGKPAGLTKLFIDYILSREGQEIVKEKGFIAIN